MMVITMQWNSNGDNNNDTKQCNNNTISEEGEEIDDDVERSFRLLASLFIMKKGTCHIAFLFVLVHMGCKSLEFTRRCCCYINNSHSDDDGDNDEEYDIM